MSSEADFVPQIGHWSENIAINANGSLFAMFHLSGYAAQLADIDSITALAESQNGLARNLADPRVEVWDHFTRMPGQRMRPLPDVPNWFGRRFDAAYRECQGGGFYRNDLFLTVLLHPEGGLLDGLAAMAGASGASDHPMASRSMLQDFDDVIQRLEAGIARYGVRRLGLRGGLHSEIFEALHVVANNSWRPIGLTRPALDGRGEAHGRMGRLIVPERIVFGDRRPGTWEIIGEGASHLGAMLSFKAFPARTRPIMFDALRSAPYGLTITNSARFRQKSAALAFLSRRINQMKSGEDAATEQVQELADDAGAVMGGKAVHVSHHCSVAVHAASLEALDRAAADAQSEMSDAGVTVVRESDALKPAFYAQLPGNLGWRPRPGYIRSDRWVALAAKHNVPRGHDKGRWGAPIIMLRTTSNTEYAFHFQVQGSAQIPAEDLANCLLIGPAGSGKTSLMGSVCLLALRNPATRVVLVDKDYGLSVMVRAAGGSYLVLPSGEPSGLAPLRGLANTPEDIGFLERFVRGLILADGHGELSSAEDERLQRAVIRQMEMPPELRSLAGVAVMLGQRSVIAGRESASARLRKWCRRERLGWAFDNERDELRMDTRIVGFDTTALLKDETVSSPTLSYLFYRTRKLIDGQPLVLAVDEFWQTDKVPAFRDENNDHLKTIRKNEGAVVLATQSARDALNSPSAHTFKQQVPTKIFFGDDTASEADLVDGLGLTRSEYLAVTRDLPNMRHTFLMKRPGGSILCRFDLGGARDKVAVISARRSTYDLMNRLIARHGNAPEAWVPNFERLAPGVVDEPTLAAPVMEAAE